MPIILRVTVLSLPCTHATESAIEPARHTRIALYVLAAFALGQAIQVNNGYLHPVGLGWVVVALGLILRAVNERGWGLVARLPLVPLLALLVAIQWSELLIWGLRWLPRFSSSIGWFAAAMALSATGVIVLMRRPARWGVAMSLLLAGHLVTGQHVIRATPHQRIDVWQFQQAGSDAILQGQNPYHVRLRNPYTPNTDFYGPGMVENGWLTISYPYPPLTLLTTTPAKLVLGDIRYAHLLAIALAVILLARAAPGPTTAWIAAILLLTPRSMLVIRGGWTEPLVALLLAGTLWCAVRAPRRLWVVLGMLLASKQYAVLVLPIIVLLRRETGQWRATLRLLAGASVVAASITLPLACWDLGAFWRSVVLMQFQQPFRADALSFNAMLAYLTGVRIGAGLGLFCAAAAVIFGLRRAPRSPAGFAGVLALVLLCFFAFNKQAFCNYYYLVICTCCFAAALSAPLVRARM